MTQSSKKKLKQQQHQKLQALSTLGAQRQGAHELSAALVAATFERFMPKGQNPWLEIGSGDGQLHRWLPHTLRERVVLSESSTAFVQGLRRRFGEAQVRQLDVHHLKADVAEFSAVMALCVLDVLTLSRAVAELARVLEPGGLVLHWLDMATSVEPIMASAAAEGLVVLPKFVDLGGNSAISGASRSSLGVGGMASIKGFPLLDLVVSPRAQLLPLCDLLRRTGHPQASALDALLRESDPGNFDPRRAATAFVQLTLDIRAQFELCKTLFALYVASAQAGSAAKLPFEARPVSSLEHFRARVRQSFADSGSFELLFDDVVRARHAEPRPLNVPRGLGYHGVWLGQALQTEVEPKELPGELWYAGPNLDGPPENSWITEVAMHCFVLRRK